MRGTSPPGRPTRRRNRRAHRRPPIDYANRRRSATTAWSPRRSSPPGELRW